MITFATDCSGLDAPFYALESIVGSCEINYIFASELQPKLRTLLSTSIGRPKMVYDDITKRNVSQMESVDLYICGFPCQSFSLMGMHKGFRDVRGHVFYHVHEYIKTWEPKVFVLENVVGILSNNHGATFKTILSALHEIGKYHIEHRIISPLHVGIPQSRNRVFIVGIHQEKTNWHGTQLEWTCDKTEPTLQPIANFLISRSQAAAIQPRVCRQLTTHGKQNLAKANDLVSGIQDKTYIFDLRLSKHFYLASENVCPCLTTFGRSYFISSQSRYLTCLEAMRLQGLDNDYLLTELQVSNPMTKNKTDVYAWIGNSMCVPVVAAVLIPLVEILYS